MTYNGVAILAAPRNFFGNQPLKNVDQTTPCLLFLSPIILIVVLSFFLHWRERKNNKKD